MLVTPSEKEVSDLIEKGYLLHSVTPTVISTGSLSFIQHALVYHFIKNPGFLMGYINSDEETMPNPFDPPFFE
jgi:hypothetical protein